MCFSIKLINSSFLLYVVLLCVPGCASCLIKIEGLPNSFELTSTGWHGEIVWVEVYHVLEGKGKLVWKIRPVHDISATNFRIYVGSLPPGFEQIVPSPSVRFELIPGDEYSIYVVIYPYGPDLVPPLASWVSE